jgi:DNA-binding CsgD family transcriptional regulator/PAS domain-containing protein
MNCDPLALDLIGRIYDAAVDPTLWQGVAEGFSEVLGGSAVALALKVPGNPCADRRLAAGIDASHGSDCVDAFLGKVPRAAAARYPLARGFAFATGSAERPIDAGAFPEHWREPRRLADAWPIGHLISIENDRPIASIVAFRKEGSGAFTESDVARANRFVPHLARAFDMYRSYAAVTRQRRALAEVMDRLPTGVILLNDEGRVVLANRSAIRILERNDGLALTRDALHAADDRADEALQKCIGEVVAPPQDEADGVGGIVAVPRTSGEAPYPVSVSRLLPGTTIHDAVAAVLVSDPDTGTEPAVELLRNLHQLTPAEADLVDHLARGRSLEEAARARGVSIHTARSQLKQVFFKTGTHRQGELVQLVLRYFVPRVRK